MHTAVCVCVCVFVSVWTSCVWIKLNETSRHRERARNSRAAAFYLEVVGWEEEGPVGVEKGVMG